MVPHGRKREIMHSARAKELALSSRMTEMALPGKMKGTIRPGRMREMHSQARYGENAPWRDERDELTYTGCRVVPTQEG